MDQRQALEDAERRHREALEALARLRAEYEADRRRWQREVEERVAAAGESWRKRLEEARREHDEDLRVLQEEQDEALAAIEQAKVEKESFEREKKAAVWQAKQELQSRYESQLSGMLRTAGEARKAALASAEEELRKAKEDLEAERQAHQLTRERLESKEAEIQQHRGTAERWRSELERLRSERDGAAAAAEARARQEIQQAQFFRAAALAKAYEEARKPGAGSEAADHLGELIEELVREVS